MWQGSLVLLFLVHCSWAKPLDYHRYLTLKDDVDTVESLRRDVRAPMPLEQASEVKDLLNDGGAANKNRNAKAQMKNSSGKSDEGGYYKTYGSDAEGEKGYLKSTYSKGDHGYKTLDTFHKQDGDKYGFEKHIAYGKAHADKKSGHHDNAGFHSAKDGDHEGAGTVVDTHYAEDEGDLNDRGSEYSYYGKGGDHDRYTDGDGYHYTESEPKSSSYGHSESYSSGNDEDGSYETHSSYSTGDDGQHEYE